MDVMFWGMVYPTMAVLPSMLRRRSGRIVNVTSIGGKIAVPHLVPYGCAKFAAVGFSEGLGAELRRKGISVTTVVPGLMRTGSPINASMKGQHEREFAWFAVSDSIPGLSIQARRAARKILEACRRGQAELIITPQARLAAALYGLMPSTVTSLGTVAGRLLPDPTGFEGDRPRLGRDSGHLVPRWMTALSDRAARRNNEVERPRVADPDFRLSAPDYTPGEA